ncbi:MAG: hypothetical protein HOF35_13080 [Bacteroidetes bacterium]|jgi:hypothetical protein|nr:hypothetical protein [Bacteroidota bacterium]
MKPLISNLFMLTVVGLSFAFSQDTTQVENKTAMTSINPTWKHYVSANIGILKGNSYDLRYGYLPRNIEIRFRFDFNRRFGSEIKDNLIVYDFFGWDTTFSGSDTNIAPILIPQEFENVAPNDKDENSNIAFYITRTTQKKTLNRLEIMPYYGIGLSHVRYKRSNVSYNNSSTYRYEYLDDDIFYNVTILVGMKSTVEVYKNIHFELDYSINLNYAKGKEIDDDRMYTNHLSWNYNPVDEFHLIEIDKKTESFSSIDIYTGTLKLMLKYYF